MLSVLAKLRIRYAQACSAARCTFQVAWQSWAEISNATAERLGADVVLFVLNDDAAFRAVRALNLVVVVIAVFALGQDAFYGIGECLRRDERGDGAQHRG